MNNSSRMFSMSEILDMAGMGIMVIDGVNFTETDITSLKWTKAKLSKMIGKPSPRTKMKFTINKDIKITQMVLMASNGNVCEIRWITKSVSDAIRSWLDKAPIDLHVLEIVNLTRGPFEEFCSNEIEYYITDDYLIMKIGKELRTITLRKLSGENIEKLTDQDLVNLLYEFS